MKNIRRNLFRFIYLATPFLNQWMSKLCQNINFEPRHKLEKLTYSLITLQHTILKMPFWFVAGKILISTNCNEQIASSWLHFTFVFLFWPRESLEASSSLSSWAKFSWKLALKNMHQCYWLAWMVKKRVIWQENWSKNERI